jgi:hypothetical protein
MRESMEIYPRTALERAMKLHEVLLRASAGKIKSWQAAELMGIGRVKCRRQVSAAQIRDDWFAESRSSRLGRQPPGFRLDYPQSGQNSKWVMYGLATTRPE